MKKEKKEELRRSAFLGEQERIRKLFLEETRNHRGNVSARVADNVSQSLTSVAVTVDVDDDDLGRERANGATERSGRRGERRGKIAFSGLAASDTIASPTSTPKTHRTFRRKRMTSAGAPAGLEPPVDVTEDPPSTTATPRGRVVDNDADNAPLDDPTRQGRRATVCEGEGDEDDDDPLSKPIDTSNVRVPVWVTLLIMTCYILGGAFMFTMWEQGWDFLEGSYFCFITLSTIGFGDFVPGTSLDSWAAQEKWIICCVYLLLGMAMQAMCFHLMQEEVRAKFRRLAARLGLVPPVEPVLVVRMEAAEVVGVDSEDDEEESLVK